MQRIMKRCVPAIVSRLRVPERRLATVPCVYRTQPCHAAISTVVARAGPDEELMDIASSMGRTALLFPGQGAQKVGMAKDLYEDFAAARLVLEEVDEALQLRLSRTMFEGDAVSTHTV